MYIERNVLLIAAIVKIHIDISSKISVPPFKIRINGVSQSLMSTATVLRSSIELAFPYYLSNA